MLVLGKALKDPGSRHGEASVGGGGVSSRPCVGSRFVVSICLGFKKKSTEPQT